jgi:hypothetical protein
MGAAMPDTGKSFKPVIRDSPLPPRLGMQILQSVSLDKKTPGVRFPTFWSVVYQSTGRIDIAINRKYDEIFSYEMDMK